MGQKVNHEAAAVGQVQSLMGACRCWFCEQNSASPLKLGCDHSSPLAYSHFLLNCSSSFQGVQAVRPPGFHVVQMPHLEKGPQCGQEVWFVRALLIRQGRSSRTLFVRSAANSYKIVFQQFQPGWKFKAGTKMIKWPNFSLLHCEYLGSLLNPLLLFLSPSMTTWSVCRGAFHLW